MEPTGDFLFGTFSFLPGAFQRGPLPVFEFLLPPDAFPFFLLPGAFLFGAFFFQPGPLPLCAFLSKPVSFLARAILQRPRQFFPGNPFLLGRLLPVGKAVTLGRQLLLAPGVALLLLAGAFLGGRALTIDLRGTFLGGRALTLELCGAFLLQPGAFLFKAGPY